MIRLKISIGTRTEYQIQEISSSIVYGDFLRQLRGFYADCTGNPTTDPLTVEYVDADQDRIAITSQENFDIFLQECHRGRLTMLKVFLSTRKGGLSEVCCFRRAGSWSSLGFSAPLTAQQPQKGDAGTAVEVWKRGNKIGAGAFGVVYQAMSSTGMIFVVKEIQLPPNAPPKLVSLWPETVVVVQQSLLSDDETRIGSFRSWAICSARSI